MKKSKLIKYLFVLPRNKFYCQYQINDEPSVRAMKYEDMQDYILNLLPNKAKEIRELLIVYKKYFFVDVVKDEIRELSFDSEKEIDDIKRNMRGETMKAVNKDLKTKDFFNESKKISKNFIKENKYRDYVYSKLSKMPL